MANTKMSLINLFKKCFDILRDNEALTGDKALRELSYLLILKLIEPKLDEFELTNYEYDFEDFTDEQSDKLLRIIKFSELAKEDAVNLKCCLNNLWQCILNCHPKTNNIFTSNKVFEIKNNYTFKQLIKTLNSINLNEIDYDILGNVYEEVISTVMIGKTLGQFFTQNIIKKIMINLINPKLNEDGSIESLCDPTMGTGGFLISYINDIITKSKERNIKLDWNNIKTQIFGQEIERDTYQLAVSNMLISTGQIFDHLQCGDSIRQPILQKFDNILANPPFGIKGLKYDEIFSNLSPGIESKVMLEYIPIKSNNAVSLFIQAIIYMLKVNGKCAVVIPDGQDLFSKTNKSLIAIREYLLRTCDLQEIIYMPSGVFTYTSIKTCIFYFIKKIEIEDTLHMEIKYNKLGNKELSRKYNYTKDFQTKSVKFYEYSYEKQGKDNIILKDKILLVDVSIEQLQNNKFSLNYSEYIENIEEFNYGSHIEIKTLGELCKFLPSTKHCTNIGLENGNYRFYNSSLNGKKLYLNSYEIKEESLIIGNGGNANVHIDKEFTPSKHVTVLQLINNDIILKYIYYYLLTNLDILNNKSNGVSISWLNREGIKNIKIPIPPLERQEYIIEYLSFIHETRNKTLKQSNEELKKLNDFYIKNQILWGSYEYKTLGELCEINYGTRILKKNIETGIYPVYGGGGITSYSNNYNRENFNIVISRFAISKNCVRLINNKFYLNDSGMTIIIKNINVLNKFLGYYLFTYQDNIYNCGRGTAQKNLDMELFKNIKIPIPPLEEQEKYISYCENNQKEIENNQKEIENNIILAKEFLNKML